MGLKFFHSLRPVIVRLLLVHSTKADPSPAHFELVTAVASGSAVKKRLRES